jgi:GNAT superfamily N-acetyltransferase
MMPRAELLALYDREMRRDPAPYPGTRIEHGSRTVRVVGVENFVIYSDLNEETAPAAIAEEAEFFRGAGAAVEWKAFGHDRPANLPRLLADARFVPDEPETIVVYDLASGVPEGTPPVGVDVRQVPDPAGWADADRVHAAAFAPDAHPTVVRSPGWIDDPRNAMVVAYVDGAPVASGRLEMPDGRSFAGLYGGGTAPGYRHRGIYRSLVAARATLARSRGYRFLTVDARETSRPILERLGFVPLTTTRGWVLRPGP